MGLDNPLHIAFLLVVVLLVFGAKRLPEMGKSLGSGMRGFKDALGGESEHPPLAPAETTAAVAAGQTTPKHVAAPAETTTAPGADHTTPERLAA